MQVCVVSLAELVLVRVGKCTQCDDWTPACAAILFTTEQELLSVISSTCFSPCGRFLAAGITGNVGRRKVTALLWDVESGNVVCTLQGPAVVFKCGLLPGLEATSDGFGRWVRGALGHLRTG